MADASDAKEVSRSRGRFSSLKEHCFADRCATGI